MVELTSEEQSYLRRLQEVSERGESVDGYIWNRLDNELSTLQGIDSMGCEIRTYSREYELERRVYETLAKRVSSTAARAARRPRSTSAS